ncbi:MAG: POTRA domain-containing protein, partial [Betaproteobacteria bacterium]
MNAAERPDSGTIQRTLPQPIPSQRIPTTIPESNEVELDPQGPTARIDRFDISGNESIATEEIQAILKIFVGQALSAQDLESVKAVVGNFYRERGYWATVIFPPQDLSKNTLRMEIVEAKLGSILIDADEGLRFPIDRIANYLDSDQKRGDVLRINELDSGVRKLNKVAGIEASLDLQPGELVGETDVIVVAENTPLVNGSLTADNHGSRSTDYNRGTLSVNLESPLRAGERFNFVYLNNAELLYQGVGVTAPILFDGITMSYQYTDLVYTLGAPYETLSGYGDAQSSSTTLAKPLWQGKRAEINGSIGYAHRTNYDVASGAVSTDKKIDVWNISLSSTLQDGLFSGGFNLLSTTLSNGWVDLSGSNTDWQDDQDNARTQG